MALKINIHDIRETKSAQIDESLILNPQELDLPQLAGVTWHPVTFAYVLTNADNLFVLEGKLEGQVSLECSRCLKPIDEQLSIDIHEQYSRRSVEDDDIHVFHGEEIDVAGVLRDNIILSLPVKPLCSPDCRGLCPQCGIDKNQGSCDCNPKSVDPRLAVLEKLIRK